MIFSWLTGLESFDCANISFSKLPSYLRNTKFQNPDNAIQGPFQFGHDWTGHAFGWLTEHPEVFQAFHGYVHALRKHRPAWSEIYPVKERLIDDLKMDGDSSVFVDIGGGTGQILEDFHKSVPEYAGRLVLQELPEVINAVVASGSKLAQDSRFELQPHDFFTRQPIRGARAYFMRSVLHDWQDDKCRAILNHLKDAMEPGYSRILISDCVSTPRYHLLPCLRLLLWWWSSIGNYCGYWHILIATHRSLPMSTQPGSIRLSTFS